MTRLAPVACIAFVLPACAHHGWLTPIEARSFDYALAPEVAKTYCFTTERGLDVFVIAPVACPQEEEVVAVETDTLDRARSHAWAIRGTVVILTPFVMRCAGLAVRGCSQTGIVAAWERSWKQHTLRHELGHAILERERGDGDARHALKGFWLRLEGRR